MPKAPFGRDASWPQGAGLRHCGDRPVEGAFTILQMNSTWRATDAAISHPRLTENVVERVVLILTGEATHCEGFAAAGHGHQALDSGT